MEIKKITRGSDEAVDQISSIHLNVLGESFLNNFGIDFLKIIYRNLIESQNSIVLGSFEDKKITGYLLAVRDYSKFLKTTTSNRKLSLTYIVIKTVLRKPELLKKILTSLVKTRDENSHAELQFIALLPEAQGKNLGTELVQELNREFLKIGIKEYIVGTKSSNELSNKFYNRLGFMLSHKKEYFGDELNYYKSPMF